MEAIKKNKREWNVVLRGASGLKTDFYSNKLEGIPASNGTWIYKGLEDPESYGQVKVPINWNGLKRNER
ncbi:MAG TPA: hypothetical protein VGK10_10730 [Prolixibacteraceae bacterium]|jgi:hypothetical protein